MFVFRFRYGVVCIGDWILGGCFLLMECLRVGFGFVCCKGVGGEVFSLVLLFSCVDWVWCCVGL